MVLLQSHSKAIGAVINFVVTGFTTNSVVKLDCFICSYCGLITKLIVKPWLL